MLPEATTVDVTPDNIADHPGAICFINPKHELYHKKVEWLTEQYTRGLKIKLLYLAGEKKPVGFVEYVPGEHCWRGVDAAGWMFIHCLWTNGKNTSIRDWAVCFSTLSRLMPRGLMVSRPSPATKHSWRTAACS